MEKEKLSPPSQGSGETNPKNTMPKAELVSLVFEMGYTIAIPIVFFALAGRWLDKSLHSSPLFILIGVIISIAISSFLVYKKMAQYLK